MYTTYYTHYQKRWHQPPWRIIFAKATVLVVTAFICAQVALRLLAHVPSAPFLR